MLLTLFVCITAFTLLYVILLVQSVSIKNLEADIEYLKAEDIE